MARPLLPSLMHNLPFSSSMPMSLFFVLLAIFCVFSVITFLCGSGKLKKLHTETEEKPTRSKEHKLISKLNSNLGNKTLSMVKMLSWKKVQSEGEEEGDYDDQDEEEALWRKNILMGERCRPLNFSGKIEHDSEGN
ncbi:uncharacterized protein LOC113874467 [Abrus precatorius]|uniref:Uncharacterized protein LOC113874467 n=1 Tax=Abrus precatorius TaxID=3816 RepID=A0A8B8MLK7_ABRPR|nr:uncharacterized protein LOC113874467 [Abrus precatorius]